MKLLCFTSPNFSICAGNTIGLSYSDDRYRWDKVAEEASVTGSGWSGDSSYRLLAPLKVPTVQVEGYRAEVFREKPTRIAINKESKFGPLGK